MADWIEVKCACLEEEEEELSLETMMVCSGQAESTPAWQGRRELILLAGAARVVGRRVDKVAKVWKTLLLSRNLMVKSCLCSTPNISGTESQQNVVLPSVISTRKYSCTKRNN